VNYLLYVPFELLFPWGGRWDDLPAAHAAAIFFDLLCIAGLFLLGRRIRDTALGVVLVYAWVTFPFTLFALNTNSNDALVAALLIGVLLVANRTAARGALAALAGVTKVAPLALAPLLATQDGWRRVPRFAIVFAVTAAIAMIPVWLQGDLGLVWDRIVGYQATRGAPFSVWGLYGGLDALQHIVQGAAVVLAVAVAVVPRRRDLIGLAALMGAVLVALQLGVTYWFYLYITWVIPLALVAFLAREPQDEPVPPPESGPSRLLVAA